MATPQNDAQELIEIIPNYSGYACKNDRKKSDDSLRTALVKKMKQTHDALENLRIQSRKQGKTELAKAIERIQSQLQTVTQNVQVPAYSEEEFFEREALPQNGLDKICNHDRAMTEQAQTLLEEVQALQSQEALDEAFSDYFNHLQDLIDRFNQNLMEREFVIASGGEEF
ncbi:MAG: hypothetical protein ACE5IW_12290 [bacterium]